MNKKLSKSDRFDYTVEPFQEDFTGHLSWHMLGSRILAAASMHANRRGFGMEQLMPKHCAWVLSRLAIEMSEMPRAGEQYYIETWIRSIYRTFTDRCFAILRPDGTPYGYAYTIWALINTETRLPINLEQLPDGGFADMEDKDKPCNVSPFSKIRVKAEVPERRLEARYSDIDINNHVNSIRYIEHALDLFPKENFAAHPASRIEMAYHEEAYAGEQLSFYREQTDSRTFNVEIRKNDFPQEQSSETPAGKSDKAVCACKITFR